MGTWNLEKYRHDQERLSVLPCANKVAWKRIRFFTHLSFTQVTYLGSHLIP